MTPFFIGLLSGATFGVTVFAWFTRHAIDRAFKQGRDFTEGITSKTYANAYQLGYDAGNKAPRAGEYEDVRF